MMNFRTVNQAIIDTLGEAAAGRFRVVGFARQGIDATEAKDSKRIVQSYFTSGRFKGPLNGPVQHAMAFTIGLTVSAAARVNLAVMNNPAATAGQLSAALSALQEASYLADRYMDELFELVYQIIMDGRNYDMGLPVGTVSNRWIEELQKDAPQPNGELVMLTGSVQFTCQTCEAVTGDTGTPIGADGGIDTVIDIDGDNVERTGVENAG